MNNDGGAVPNAVIGCSGMEENAWQLVAAARIIIRADDSAPKQWW